MKILVTGGAGYIGSHTVLSLLENSYQVVVYDNLSNSSIESIARVQALTNKEVDFIEGDIKDKAKLRQIFSEHKIDAVIHFAALKAVGESMHKPLSYYQSNIHGTICLLEVMEEYNVNEFIFSSSATVYGEENNVPYVETMSLGTPASPYGASKVMIERVLQDQAFANNSFRGVSLRYFNPIGAHESGEIGEDPKGIPNNLLPYVAQVAVGKREKLSIFGGDYPTADGSCERDYLHVVDLAKGHVAAVKWLEKNQSFKGIEAFNLGTGVAVSVFSIVKAFELASAVNIPFEIAARRAGDLPAFWANADKASEKLQWQAEKTLEEMMIDTFRWQSKYPNGYAHD
ncbi:UDP-glucose 4-epimerase GalE [Thalassotalea profundi]|uniref:UDP-glucose 4-epimerase n=1 Tax=Thalassotalea profundi TaxID=2036687 RepID=A0ABQ3IRP0_9GAMM|nr:UDP-glucose 4-epimerase GalE [Thalassotalea profundi]GHE88947.1 UDP-glucose 4-epimerase [Thalassotalea profundi]